MGDFEDKIRKKLQEGEMNYNPSDWEDEPKSIF